MKIRNHEQALDDVYKTVSEMRLHGRVKITVSEVAKKSGVSRATIQSKHPDWVLVKEVILYNKPSERIHAECVKIDDRQKWQKEANRLAQELIECKKLLVEVDNFSDRVFKKLVDQLHKYFILAKQTPAFMNNHARVMNDLTETRSQLEYYIAENKLLRAESSRPANVQPFTKKTILTTYDGILRADLTYDNLFSLSVDIIENLGDYFLPSKGVQSPQVTYLLCGNFASGKSDWIKNHRPVYPGVNLYIDGTNHTIDIRMLALKRIRKLSPSCKIICVRVMADEGECLANNKMATRQRLAMAVPEELIKRMTIDFKELSINEGFDEIVIVGGK